MKMDKYVYFVYKLSKNFPKKELYGVASQIRRSSLSVILNYIKGFARYKRAVKLNFWEISYGSLKESKYLPRFCLTEKYINQKEYQNAVNLAEEIGTMLWKSIQLLK